MNKPEIWPQRQRYCAVYRSGNKSEGGNTLGMRETSNGQAWTTVCSNATSRGFFFQTTQTCDMTFTWVFIDWMKLTVILSVDRAIVLDMCLNSCIVFHFFARFTHNEKDESIKENTYNVLLHPQGGGFRLQGLGSPYFQMFSTNVLSRKLESPTKVFRGCLSWQKWGLCLSVFRCLLSYSKTWKSLELGGIPIFGKFHAGNRKFSPLFF